MRAMMVMVMMVALVEELLVAVVEQLVEVMLLPHLHISAPPSPPPRLRLV